jgi:hypothetical protein
VGQAVAVLIPCFDEEATIAKVVADFRKALPEAMVYVYDNGSSDRTAVEAARAGAVVRREPWRGKGRVVRRMFADVDADAYLLVDGDDTYAAEDGVRLLRRLADEHLDMVVGSRARTPGAYRSGHELGNAVLSRTVSLLFGARFTDVLSGYRALSRRFVKSYAAVLSSGFEIETEINVHALEMRVPVGEEPVAYAPRPAGSRSKLRTLQDGARIALAILLLLEVVRPFLVFGSAFLVLSGGATALALPIFRTYLETGLVPRFPTAILATGMMLLAFLSLACGLILDSVSRGRRELKRLFYLAAGSEADHRVRDAAVGGSARD